MALATDVRRDSVTPESSSAAWLVAWLLGTGLLTIVVWGEAAGWWLWVSPLVAVSWVGLWAVWLSAFIRGPRSWHHAVVPTASIVCCVLAVAVWRGLVPSPTFLTARTSMTSGAERIIPDPGDSTLELTFDGGERGTGWYGLVHVNRVETWVAPSQHDYESGNPHLGHAPEAGVLFETGSTIGRVVGYAYSPAGDPTVALDERYGSLCRAHDYGRSWYRFECGD